MMSFGSKLPGWLAVAFSLLSAITSGVGLWWIFAQNSDDLRVSIGLAALATTLLQACILCLWDLAAASALSRRMRLLLGVVGLAASLASGLFAAGSYIAVANLSAVQTLANDERLSTVVEPLARASAKWLSLATDLEGLADQTRRKAGTEARIGGTCLGDSPQEGRGPRYRLRQRHAQEAEQMAGLARALSGQAVVILHNAQGGYSRESMLRAFRAARDLASHRDLHRIAGWLRQEAAGFNGQFIDPETNGSFVCRDPELQGRLSKAAETIDSGFDLPLLPPEPVEITVKDTIGKSYRDAFELARMTWNSEFDSARYHAISYSFVGYAAAAAVEFVIIFLLFVRAAVQRACGRTALPRDIWNDIRRTLSPALRRDYRRWVPLILKLLLEDRNRVYFARPIDGAPEVVARCLEIFLRLKLPVDPDLRPDIPLADLYPEWVEARADVHSGARRFALHPLNEDMLEWLRRASRDLDIEAEPQQPTSDDGKVVDLRARRPSFNWKPVAGLLALFSGAAAVGLSGWSGPDLPRPALPTGEDRAVKVRADGNGHFYMTVEINGIPIRAIVDTGATNVALTYEDAERLSLRPSALNYDVRTSTANGEALKALVTLAEVHVGHIHVRDVKALVGRPGSMENNLLGMSFLRNVGLSIEGDQLALHHP